MDLQIFTIFPHIKLFKERKSYKPALKLVGTSYVAARLLQADQQIVNLLHVLRGRHGVRHSTRLREGLAEQGLDVHFTLSLVLTRLADCYYLI